MVDSGATSDEEPSVDDDRRADLTALRAAVDDLRADVAELRSGLEQAGLDSERRVVARVDEAVLVLAEALLRPRPAPLQGERGPGGVVHAPVVVAAGDATTPVLPEAGHAQAGDLGADLPGAGPSGADSLGDGAGDPVHPPRTGGRRRAWWRPGT